MSAKPTINLSTFQTTNTLAATGNSSCRFCGNPAQEKYRFWVGKLEEQTRTADSHNHRVMIETTFSGMTCHDVDVCNTCQAEIWNGDKQRNALIAIVSLFLGIIAAILWRALPGMVALPASQMALAKWGLVLVGAGLGVWSLSKLLLLFHSINSCKMESLIMEKVKHDHTGEGDAFFTNSDYQMTFLNQPRF
jgi:hypothetical protein